MENLEMKLTIGGGNLGINLIGCRQGTFSNVVNQKQMGMVVIQKQTVEIQELTRNMRK